MTTLDELDDYDYRSEFKQFGLHDSEGWKDFVEPHRLERTIDMLDSFASNLKAQLLVARESGDSDSDWMRRTIHLKVGVERRLAQARRVQREMSGVENLQKANEDLTAWKAVVDELIDLLDGHPALEDLDIPGGDLSLSEWAEIRRERKVAA